MSLPNLSTLHPERRKILAPLLELTRGMRLAAEEGDWDRLIALEEERRPLIAALFEPPPQAPESPALRVAIKLIQDQDREIMSLAGAGLEEFRREMRTLDSGRRAVKAYGGG